ncbi:MAG: sensor histidine kinase [Bacillota bacterium]
MNYVFKSLFFLYIIVKLIISGETSIDYVALVLLLAASNIYREKFSNTAWLLIVEAAIITYGAWNNGDFIFLFCMLSYDLAYMKLYGGILCIMGISLYLLRQTDLVILALLLLLCALFGYIKSNLEKKEKQYRDSYDKERQYRYELEQAKVRLMNSSKEVAHITEVRERNRIAREIHDNVGHNIAGILMQLQAAQKLRKKDDGKSDELLKSSIDALSDTLVVLRDTVHNIKPKENVGLDYIKSVVDSFLYCPVSFKFTGSFDLMTASHIEILSSNIKEALTNVSKYSNATLVDINIDINDKFVRLFIKDNGKGCEYIKEGLGLNGMKERIRNIGGNISIDASNGFLIVCIMPIQKV